MKNDTKMWLVIITASVILASVLVWLLMKESEREANQEFWDFSVRETSAYQALQEVLDRGVSVEELEIEQREDEVTVTSSQREEVGADGDTGEQMQAESSDEEPTSTTPAFEPVVLYRADGTYFRSSTGKVIKVSTAVGYWAYLNEPNDEYPIPNGDLFRNPAIAPDESHLAYCITTVPGPGGCYWYVYDITGRVTHEVSLSGGTSTESSTVNLSRMAWRDGLLVGDYETTNGEVYTAESLSARRPWQIGVSL